MPAQPFVAYAYAFFRLEPLPRLRLLHLDVTTALTIARMPALARLKGLAVSGDAKARLAICASAHLGGLEALGFAGYVGQRLLRAIASGPALGGLRSLELGGSGTRPAPEQAIGSFEALFELIPIERLVVRGHALDDLDVKGLCAADPSSLRELRLGGNCIADAGARAIADAESLANLRGLCLWGNRVDHEGAESLARSNALEALEWLEIGGNPIGPAGALALARLPRLRVLGVAHAGVDDAAAEALAAAAPALERLDLRGTALGARAVARLCERFADRVLLDGQ